MDTLAQIGFKADTSDLVKADKALSNLETTAASTEKQLKVAESGMKSMGAASAAQASQVQKFVQVLQDEAATIGMSSKELALYKANQLGATQADKQAIVAAIDKIEAYERSAAAAKANAAATAQMGGAYGGARGAMQSFGYQLQDTIVQAQMGANAFMILSQQGSQMASAFGPTGAIVGALIAVAGVAGMVLAPSLMDSKTNAEKLATAMDALGEAAERNEDGVLQLTNEIKELAKQSDLAAKAQLQAVMIKSAEAMTLASKAAADMVDSLTGAGYGLYDVSDAMKELNLQFGYFGGGRSKAFTETVTEIGEKFGQTGKAAEQLGIDVLKAIKAMGEAKSPEGINKAREYLLQTAQAAKMSDKELADFIVTINKLATDGITAADTTKLLADSLSDGGVGAASAKDKLKELTQQAMLAKEEFVNGEAAAHKLALAFELGFDSAKQLTPELSAQVDELIRWQKAGKEVEEQIRRIAKLEAEMEDAFGGEDMLTEVYQNRAKAAEKLMDEWSEGVDEFQSQGQAIDSLVTSVTNLGGAWSSSGSAMIDAFGSAADVIDDYIKRVGEVSDLEVKLKAVRDDSSSSAIDKSKAEVALLDLQYQGQRANLSMLSKTAGAAASMFKEQSKERKALHMAEKTFAAIEIALALQKAGANAITAVTSAFAAPFPVNFAAGAAMIAIMSGLGVFGGGGGGGSYSIPTSGTGTVAGDSEAKSSSIDNLQEEYKDIALDQLSELRTISESMNALSSGIAGLAMSLLRSSSFGGANTSGLGSSSQFSAPSFMEKIGDKFSKIDPLIGIFDGILSKVLGGISKTTKSLVDSGIKFDAQNIADILSGGFEGMYYSVIETTKKKLWGLSKKTTTGTEVVGVESAILDEIGAIFGYLSSSVTSAVDLLGVDAANAIDTFVVNLGSVSFKDMTGDEIQKELEAMFSQQGDLMALYVLPQIAEYQNMGEGALETLLRVSKEQAVFNDSLKMIGQSLGGLSALMRIDVAQSIITMMGGLEEFNSAVNLYFEEFFTETEQFDYLTKSLQEAFESLGVPMADTREEFRALVDGLDLTTDAGQKMFSALMQLVPGLAEWLKLSEKQVEEQEKAVDFTKQRLDLEIRLQDALGNSAVALEMRRKLELESVDESLRALLMQIYAAEDAAAAQRELASAQEVAAQAARDAASAAIDAAQNAFGKLQESAQREKDRLGTELDLKLEAINAEKDLLKQQRDSVIDGYQEQGKAVEQYINKLEGLNDILTGFLSDTGTQANPFKELAMIYNEAKAGLLPESSRLSSVLSGVSSAGSAGFSSAFEQNRAMAIARNQAAGIQGVVGGAMGGAKSQLQWIEYQATAADEYYIAQLAKLDVAAETAQKLHDEQVGRIDEQLTEAQKQLNALLGVDDRLLTIDEALIEFYAAMNAANELGLGVASEQVAAINRVEAAIVQVGQQIAEIAKPDGRVWVPPTMPDRFTNDGKVVTQEMLDVLTQILHAQEATAKHTKTTADVVELNQYEAQEAAL